MRCIECGGDTVVSNSRETFRGYAVRRKRTCKECGKVSTTYEVNATRPDIFEYIRSGAEECIPLVPEVTD